MARKKKRSILRSLLIMLLCLCMAFVLTYYFINLIIKPKAVLYPAFGIDIPRGYAIHGIDVSRYQQVIDWDEVSRMKVKNITIGFVFIKATDGTDKVDPQFRRNWQQAGENKIIKGAYHYFIAGKSGNKQAQNFIDIVSLQKGDLPPVLDIEEDNSIDKKVLSAQIKIWLDKAEQHYKTKPVIYTNIGFYNNYLRDSFEYYPYWIAHYRQPERPRINNKWLFWQHSKNGHVNGIKPAVDFNVFSGDSTALKNLLIK